MNNKKVLPVLLIIGSTLCLIWTFTLPNYSKSRQEVGTYPALKQDLLSPSGEKVLEVIEASYRTTETGLDSSSVLVRNLSGKNITGMGIVWTVSYSDGKKDVIDQVVDYKIHQDMVEAKGLRPFAPYEEKFIPRLTKASVDEGQRIKSVEVKFSFVEFEDTGSAGTEITEEYAQILYQRQGAEIYKRWIEGSFRDDPLNIRKVISKLESDELPSAQEFKEDRVRQGALIYRQWMRDIIKDKGESALKDQIHRQLRKR
jgi:hypothetical protein